MYQKRKRLLKRAEDELLLSIIKEFLKFNEDTSFIISKKFIEKNNDELGDEIKGLPVIITTTPLEQLVVPSSIKIDKKGYITNWCDNSPLIKILYSKITYTDGNIKDKKIKNLYLDIAESEKLEKLKSYK